MKVVRVLLLVALAAGCANPPPTPSPSPTSVQPEPNPALVAFETHVAEAITQEGQLVRQLAAASAGTKTELRIVAGLVTTWAADETAWLEDNPAEPCFAEAANAYAAGISDISSSAAAFTALGEAPSPPTDAEAQAAGARLASGTESLEQAAALAKSARAACR